MPVLVVTTECEYFRFCSMQIYLNFACNFFLTNRAFGMGMIIYSCTTPTA